MNMILLLNKKVRNL